MTRKIILEGDSHSHGGRVLEGASKARIEGKPIARIGDAAICSIHGRTQIGCVSGKARIDGREVALDGDKLACGASLISGQRLVGVE